MTIAISTSSPVASVAVFGPHNALLGSRMEEAPYAASGAVLRMIDALRRDCGFELNQVTRFIADTGPGSFTGVKVGVTLAKTLAYAVGATVAGALSFDLIARNSTVVVPSRKGEWFIRTMGAEVVRSHELPTGVFRGYGLGVESPAFPLAERAGDLLDEVEPLQPEALIPTYFAEPSISVPKRPYGEAAQGAGAA